MSGLEHVHRAAVAQAVRRHLLSCDGWLGGRGDFNVFGEDVLEPGAGHRPTGAADEQRDVDALRTDGEPGFDGGSRLPPQRQDPLAPPLAHDLDIGRRPGVELIDPKPDEFGHAQACGEGEMKHRPIPRARERARVRRVQQGLDLGPGQGGDQALVDLLHGNRMHAQGLI